MDVQYFLTQKQFYVTIILVIYLKKGKKKKNISCS